MKTKIIGALIVVPIVVGTILLANWGELTQGKELMPTLFLCFFGVIIALQVVPAIMLFRVLIREMLKGSAKPKEEVGADIGPGR
jgi:hypothetical protein